MNKKQTRINILSIIHKILKKLYLSYVNKVLISCKKYIKNIFYILHYNIQPVWIKDEICLFVCFLLNSSFKHLHIKYLVRGDKSWVEVLDSKLCSCSKFTYLRFHSLII